MLPPSSMATRPRGHADPDEAVRSTDDDAAASRLSAVNLGYLDDPYVSLLYRPKYGESSRKTPLINVGTHHRTYAIDRLVDRFLDRAGPEGEVQIVSLGAGSDTRFWRLSSRARPPRIRHYVELDFPHLTSMKAQRISRSPQLAAHLRRRGAGEGEKSYEVSRGGTQLSSDTYTLLPLDLRSSPGTALSGGLSPLLDPAIPTLFLAECVLCYLQPKVGEEIINWFSSTFTNCMGVIYEMCGLEGTFGQVMKRNLAVRLCSPTQVQVYRDADAQAARFADFHTTGGKNLWQIREQVIDPEELQRIAKLEHLDEIEELRLVLSHYCVAWGAKGSLTGISF